MCIVGNNNGRMKMNGIETQILCHAPSSSRTQTKETLILVDDDKNDFLSTFFILLAIVY